MSVHFTPQNDTGSGSDLGDLSLEIRGAWVSAILYEVPVMAIVSETYFRHDVRDWTNDGQFELARAKGRELLTQGIALSEFGTRRRRSYATHAAVIEGLVAAQREMEAAPAPGHGRFLGTSNVLLAKQYGLRPVGTIAHEWTMAIAVLRGYARSNYNALHLWDEVYQPPAFTPANPSEDLTIALTDTFSTKVFWDDLLSDDAGREILRRWRGVRQDSGDSKAFVRHAHDVYDRMGIDPHKKLVIFSDSLNVPRCLDLASYSRELGIGSGFGVGTNFTNDFHYASDPNKRSKALNIVLKLDSINGRHAVKISDELTKNTGDPHEVAYVCLPPRPDANLQHGQAPLRHRGHRAYRGCVDRVRYMVHTSARAPRRYLRRAHYATSDHSHMPTVVMTAVSSVAGRRPRLRTLAVVEALAAPVRERGHHQVLQQRRLLGKHLAQHIHVHKPLVALVKAREGVEQRLRVAERAEARAHQRDEPRFLHAADPRVAGTRPVAEVRGKVRPGRLVAARHACRSAGPQGRSTHRDCAAPWPRPPRSPRRPHRGPACGTHAAVAGSAAPRAAPRS